MVGKSSVCRGVLLALVLFGALASADARVFAWGNLNYSELRAEAYVNGVKFCSNNPTGADCYAKWAACDEAVGIAEGGAYYALVLVNDVSHSGQYNYRVDDYYYKPGSDLGGAGVPSGGKDYIGYGTAYTQCDVWSFGGSLSSPGGKWWHRFHVSDALSHSSDNNQYQSIYAGCSAGCPGGYSCLANKCVVPPDLTITDLQISPSQPIGGYNATFIAFLQNAGTGALTAYSPTITVDFFADGTGLGNALLTELAAGASKTMQQYGVLGAGTHAIRSVADVSNNIAESNEANNELTKSFVWSNDKPDLIVKSISVNPNPPFGGENFTLTVVVGEANGKELAQINSRIDVFAEGKPLASATAYAIYGAGATATWPGLRLPTGPHSIRAVADANNGINEANEGNNEQTTTLTWGAPQTMTLAVTGLKGEYYVGDAINIAADVKDVNGNPIKDAVVGLSDTFNNSIKKITDANGQTEFSITANKSGSHQIHAGANKNGYATVRQRDYTIKVIDYNTRLYVNVETPLGIPVYGALVRANSEFSNESARTDEDGNALLRTNNGYVSVLVNCAYGDACHMETLWVNETKVLPVKCDCRLDADGDGFTDKTEELSGSDKLDNASNIGRSLLLLGGGTLACDKIKGALSVTGYNASWVAERAASVDASTVESSWAGDNTEITSAFEAQGMATTSINKTLKQALAYGGAVAVAAWQGSTVVTVADLNTTYVYYLPTYCTGYYAGIARGVVGGLTSDADAVVLVAQGIAYAQMHPALPGLNVNPAMNVPITIVALYAPKIGSLKLPGIDEVLDGMLEEGQTTIPASKKDFYVGDKRLAYQTGFVVGDVTGFAAEQLAVGWATGEALKSAFAAKAAGVGKIGEGALGAAKSLPPETLKIIGLSKFELEVDKLSQTAVKGLGTALDGATLAEADTLATRIAANGVTKNTFLERLAAITEELRSAYGGTAETMTRNLAQTELGVEYAAKETTQTSAGLARIIDAVGENAATKIETAFGHEALVKTADATERGVFKPALAETTAEMWKTGKNAGYDIFVPGTRPELEVIGIYDAPLVTTQIETKQFKGTAILKRGEQISLGNGFGWKHILAEHFNDFKNAFGIKTEAELKELLENAVKDLKPTDKPLEFVYTEPKTGKQLTLVLSEDAPGSIQTAYPTKVKI